MNDVLAVETFGLTKEYKSTLAVDHIDLKVPLGSICGFLGKNGAGKTTTIKMLTGLKPPTSGEFAIMGNKECFGKGIKTVGYLPDVPDFYGYMIGEEFLRLCARLCHVPGDKLEDHIQSLLKQVGLHGVKNKISNYSRGMRQRLGIAQALINNPKVVFLDEPISALDPMGRRDVMDVIKGLKDSTVILSTHILSDVESICDYVIIIDKGKILIQNSMEGLKEQFAKSTAKITFYEEAQGIKFEEAMKDVEKIAIEKVNPLQFSMRSDHVESVEISRITISTLANADIPIKNFDVNVPSLEDIFYEVVGK